METKLIHRSNGDVVVRVWDGEWGSKDVVWVQMVLTEWEAERPDILELTIQKLTEQVERKVKGLPR